MKKPLISPSILSANFCRMQEEINSIEQACADLVHCDVMDGVFVPNISFGMKMVADIKKITTLPLDVHLMIVEPHKYLKRFLDSGADYLTFHVEAQAIEQAKQSLQLIRQSNAKAGIAISPDTDILGIEPLLDYCDTVTVMSVYPGFSGQVFIEGTLEKIKKLKALIDNKGLATLIEVDGGVTEQNAQKIVAAGASILVAGNTFFNAKDRKKTVDSLKS